MKREFSSLDELIGAVFEEHARAGGPFDEFVRMEMPDGFPVIKYTVEERVDNTRTPPQRYLAVILSDE